MPANHQRAEHQCCQCYEEAERVCFDQPHDEDPPNAKEWLCEEVKGAARSADDRGCCRIKTSRLKGQGGSRFSTDLTRLGVSSAAVPPYNAARFVTILDQARG